MGLWKAVVILEQVLCGCGLQQQQLAGCGVGTWAADLGKEEAIGFCLIWRGGCSSSITGTHSMALTCNLGGAGIGSQNFWR